MISKRRASAYAALILIYYSECTFGMEIYL